jgi:hypothetical protein
MKFPVLSLILPLVMLCAGGRFAVCPLSAKQQINIYGGNLVIRVTTGNHPISGAKVTVTQMRSSFGLQSYSKPKSHSKKTDGAGECRFNGLYMGTYEARIEASGYLPQSDTVAIGPGLATVTSKYELLPDEAVMGVIKGIITDNAGRGIPQAEVRIVRRDTGIEHLVISEPGGTYEKAALIPGKYIINVKAEKYQPSKRNVKLNPRQVASQDFKLALR